MSVYFVYQGITYDDQRAGGFVWSPKLNKAGHKNQGFTTMTLIRKDDFILHSVNGQVKSISIAQTDCFDGARPDYLSVEDAPWAEDGYQVDTVYTNLDQPLSIREHREWLAEKPKQNSAFTKAGTGKQQYMCPLDDEHAIYLLDQAINIQTSEDTVRVLRDALEDIIGEIDSEYDSVEKQAIDNLVEKETGTVPEWTGEKKPQEMTIASSKERERPKRNPKVAVDALQRADFRCEYNTNDRIFERKNGKGYTEPHHLIPISKYRDFDYEKCSLDTMENIFSLCSHCHNLLHYGKLEDKIPVLDKLYDERKEALERVGLGITFEELKEYY